MLSRAKQDCHWDFFRDQSGACESSGQNRNSERQAFESTEAQMAAGADRTSLPGVRGTPNLPKLDGTEDWMPLAQVAQMFAVVRGTSRFAEAAVA